MRELSGLVCVLPKSEPAERLWMGLLGVGAHVMVWVVIQEFKVILQYCIAHPY